MTTRFEVQRAIAADPAAIFEVLRSPEGHVRIDSSGMLMSADGEPAASVGDTFVVHMDREALNDYPLGLYDVTIVITAFEQDREIAWTITGQLDPPIGHIYGYRLEPIDGGTMVTSVASSRVISRTLAGSLMVVRCSEPLMSSAPTSWRTTIARCTALRST